MANHTINLSEDNEMALMVILEAWQKATPAGRVQLLATVSGAEKARLEYLWSKKG